MSLIRSVNSLITSLTPPFVLPINLFVTTHIDQDHVGGIESLRENNYKIQNVVEPANRRFETYTPGVDAPKGRVSEFTVGMYENGLEQHDTNHHAES